MAASRLEEKLRGVGQRLADRDWLYRRGGSIFALVVIVICVVFVVAVPPFSDAPPQALPTGGADAKATAAPAEAPAGLPERGAAAGNPAGSGPAAVDAAKPDEAVGAVEAPPATTVAISVPPTAAERPSEAAAAVAVPDRPADRHPSQWEANAAAWSAEPDTPLIAIVLDDMGLSRPRLATALAIDAPLTFALLTYADGLPDMARSVRERGHELLVHLPMEPRGKQDPGPGALLVRLDKAELRQRINRALDRFPGYVGVNNHMGSRFTADPAGMRILFDILRSTGHLFLDSRTTSASVALDLAAEAGVPAIRRDVFLDNTDETAAIRRQLAKTRAIALKSGTAVAIGHPRDATLSVLAEWVAEGAAAPARLAPLSAVARSRLGQGHRTAARQ